LQELSVEIRAVNGRVGVGVKWPPACELGRWKGAAIQRGLEPGSRGITIVKSRYQATTSEDTEGWKRLGVRASVVG
jgi:hypothetical protein